jgi:hypothetical protein
MTRSEEGLSVDDADLGALLAHVDGVEVRESTWAGSYYCAHVLWMSTRWAGVQGSSIALDQYGDPLVGFIHVPADLETAGAPVAAHAVRSRRERHAATIAVLASALRGIADELLLAGVTAPRRLLVSGFGPFAAVTSNPSGDLVDDEECMAAATKLAFGQTPSSLGPLVDGAVPGLTIDGVIVGRAHLDVSDACLDPAWRRSLPWALERFRPPAVIALGVHRVGSIYRVEIEPTSAGLRAADSDRPSHERGRPMDARAARNRALPNAIVRGARALGLAE